MADQFGNLSDSISSPARSALPITPSDSTDLLSIPKALWVSAAGTVAITAVGDPAGTPIALGSLNAGAIIPIRAARVWATGTTATLVALY